MFGWDVRHPLPPITIPLRANDPDVIVDLATVFAETYERGGYEADLDYSAPPVAPLDEAESQWAAELASSMRQKH